MSTEPASIEVFYSYAHEDAVLRDELEKHLSLLQRLGLISSWYNRQIVVGTDWAKVIDTHLETASIILLLVSSDFLASDYCYSVEMKRALERHQAKEARVIPILLRPVSWEGAPFEHLDVLPTDARSVTEWDNLDAAFRDIATGIRRALKDLPQLSVSAARIVLEESENNFTGQLQSLAPQRSLLGNQAAQGQEINRHQPPFLPSSHSIYRGIIGFPPLTDSRTILQRESSVKDVYAKIIQPDITALVLTGIGGVGKSTLAALSYQYVEEQRRTGQGPFTAETLWLRIDPAVTLTDLAGNIFEALGKSLPDLSHLAPQNQAVVLFSALANPLDKPRLIILDQFENLLDWQTGYVLPDRVGIGEWLDIINSRSCNSRLLLTSRPWPRLAHDHPPTYMKEYHVEGLQIAEGIELLRKRGLEPSQATEAELQAAVERSEGHPLALTVLASILHHNRSLSLNMLFNNPMYEKMWIGDIASNMLDTVYKGQLNVLQRKLLVAFSIYREPVPLDAAQFLVNDGIEASRMQVLAALRALLTQRLVQTAGKGCYQLHAIVESYAQGHFDDSNEQANSQAMLAAHIKAAQFYLQQFTASCPPREHRQRMSDIQPLIEAIWHFCQGEQWQESYNLMERENIFPDLMRWGGYAVLLELYLLLLPLDKWQPLPLQSAYIYHTIGSAYRILGQKGLARGYLEQALKVSEEVADRQGQARAINSLGRVYFDLGQMEQAIERYELALNIYREIQNLSGEAMALKNLGEVYEHLTDADKALEHYEQALRIYRKIGNLSGEAMALGCLGGIYDDLAKGQEALRCYEQALDISKTVGNRSEEAITLNGIGLVYSKLGQKAEAIKCFLEARNIHREVGDRQGEGMTLNNLSQAYIHLGQEEDAFICLRQSLTIRREIGDRKGEGITLLNIGKFYFYRQRDQIALPYFLQAKKILDEVKSPISHATQKFIDALHSKLGEEQFRLLITNFESTAQHIIDQA